MTEPRKSSEWTRPQVVIALCLLLLGWGSSLAVAAYKITQLETKVQAIEALDVKGLKDDVTQIRGLVIKIADKMKIEVLTP